MISDFPRIFPLGTGAITVEFGETIDEKLNGRANMLAAELSNRPFPGFVEAAPAYSTITVFYDLVNVAAAFPGFDSAFAAVSALLRARIAEIDGVPPFTGTEHVVPAIFGGEYGPDLEFVADRAGISASEAIEIFTARTYRVYLIGFLPGFPYLASVDERLAAPRKETPRSNVAGGSVGIAGLQTGIYPVDSPGGWQIIGRTDCRLFDERKSPPCLFSPGDKVRFAVV